MHINRKQMSVSDLTAPPDDVKYWHSRSSASGWHTWSFYGSLIMVKPRFPADLREFLKLLNSVRVEYLLIGGYAVGYYGYHASHR